jgi:hypothetical protein
MENPELNTLAASRKIFMQEKREEELARENEKLESHEMDYRSFVPENASRITVKGRQWNRYSLVKYESAEGGRRIRNWVNIFTIHKNNLIILDYIDVKGFVSDKTGKTETYQMVLKEIDAEIYAMIDGISFN